MYTNFFRVVLLNAPHCVSASSVFLIAPRCAPPDLIRSDTNSVIDCFDAENALIASVP